MDSIFSQCYISDADGVFTRYHRPNWSGGKLVLDSVQILSHATLATHGTDYVSITLKQGSTAISLIKTTNSGQALDATHEAGAALTAGTEAAFSLTGTGTQLEFDSTTPLQVVGTKGGSGGAVEVDITFKWTPKRV